MDKFENLFTVTKFRYPRNIEESFIKIVDKYTFYYEHEKTYQQFFENNNFTEIKFDEINSIKNSIIKKICFVFSILYVNGGFYTDLNIIPDDNIKSYCLENNKLYCVKSILNNGTMFLGIFGSSKQNKILLDLTRELITLDKTNNNITSEEFYKLLSRQNQEGIIYLNESKIHNNYVSTLDSSGKILFNHYVYPNNSYTIPNEIVKPTKVEDIKIGITLNLLNSVNSFFSNGINQNTLFLAELLLNIGYDVYFIVQDEKLLTINKTIIDEFLYDSRFKYKRYSEVLYSDFNIVITLSFSYTERFLYNYYKYLNIKHIGYFCGNSYLIDTEKILYNQHKDIKENNYDFTIDGFPKYDEIWSIPQMVETNLDYWSILHRCKCVEVPFVWSNNAIKLFCKANNCKEEDLYYKNRGVEKKIAIFEPNISVMKWALPSILICESAYRKNKLVKHLFVTNINEKSQIVDFNLKQFNKFMSTLDIVKDKKCSIETRHNTLSFMRDHADIVVSHQWGNPLNYLYFDLAWMGWPILHNAYLCKDVGYFYNNFNYLEASDYLIKIINTHELNKDEYIKKNREVIDKYLPTNKRLMDDYKNLITKVLN